MARPERAQPRREAGAVSAFSAVLGSDCSPRGSGLVAPRQQNEAREKCFLEALQLFLDAYGVFASKFYRFCHLPARLRAELVFKAKMVTFRERKTQNGRKVDFLVFLSRKFACNMQSGFSCGMCETSTLSDSFAILGFTSSFRITFLRRVRRICSKRASQNL